jgi:DNA-binding protein HU-beta
MNKVELIEAVAADASISVASATRAVAAVIEHIGRTLGSGSEVRLAGLGTFSTKQRPASKGRNPRTGAAIDIAARTVAKFSPAKALSERLAP